MNEQPIIQPTPITEDWLKEIGFKWHQFDRQSSRHWLLWIGGAFLERNMFQGSEDLGVELAQNMPDEYWFCWFRSDTSHRYHRFIHLRHLRTQAELTALLSALIGYPFDPANCWYGSLRTPEGAAYCRKEDERLDRKFMRSTAKWQEIEKDDSRGHALPEHYEAHEKAKKP